MYTCGDDSDGGGGGKTSICEVVVVTVVEGQVVKCEVVVVAVVVDAWSPWSPHGVPEWRVRHRCPVTGFVGLKMVFRLKQCTFYYFLIILKCILFYSWLFFTWH